MTWNRKPNSVPRVSAAPLEDWSLHDLWKQIARVYAVTNGMTDWAAADSAMKHTREEAIAFIKRAGDVICDTMEKQG